MICIECTNCDVDSTYSKLKSDFIKLTLCSQCGSVVDKYIEYDNVLIFLDIMLLKAQAYRHVTYNAVESALFYDKGQSKISWWKRYKQIIRIVLMVILFEVYLTWAYEEKKSHHSLLMKYLLEERPHFQYATFIFKQVCQQFLFHFIIQLVLRGGLGWGADGNKSLPKQHQFGYNTCVLLTIVLISSSIRLLPILMLIWPYDQTSVSNTVITFVGLLNTVDAIRISTRSSTSRKPYSYITIGLIILFAVSVSFVVSKLAMILCISIFSHNHHLSIADFVSDEMADWLTQSRYLLSMLT